MWQKKRFNFQISRVENCAWDFSSRTGWRQNQLEASYFPPEIAINLARTCTVIRNHLVEHVSYSIEKSRDRKRAFNFMWIGHLSWAMANDSRPVRKEFQYLFSDDKVWNELLRQERLTYCKFICSLDLTQAHIKAQLRWYMANASYKLGWNNVIFSDENKFNEDGSE